MHLKIYFHIQDPASLLLCNPIPPTPCNMLTSSNLLCCHHFLSEFYYLWRLISESCQTPFLRTPQHRRGAIRICMTVSHWWRCHRVSEIWSAKTGKNTIVSKMGRRVRQAKKPIQMISFVPSVPFFWGGVIAALSAL